MLKLNKLIDQLKEIDEEREELDEEEYETIKKETIDQIKEFEKNIEKISSGNVTLGKKINFLNKKVDKFESIQLVKLINLRLF